MAPAAFHSACYSSSEVFNVYFFTLPDRRMRQYLDGA